MLSDTKESRIDKDGYDSVTYLNFGVVLRCFHPSLDSGSTHSGREAKARGSGDSIFQEYRVTATSSRAEEGKQENKKWRLGLNCGEHEGSTKQST